MKMTSFYIKLFATFVAVTMSFCLLFFLLFSQTLKSHNQENVAEHLESICLLAAPQLEPLLAMADAAAVDAWAKRTGQRLGVRITVLRPDGTVVGDTDQNPARMDNHLNRPEVAGTRLHRSGRAVRHSSTLDKDMLYVAMCFPDATSPKGIVRASLPLTDVAAIYQRLAGHLAPLTLAIILVSLLLCAVITRRLSRPISAMHQVAEKVSAGDFNARVFIANRDEFGGLAEAFNRMTTEIQTLFGQLSTRQEESEAVLSAIREGLVLIDHDMRIAKANQTFLDQFHCPDAVGKPYWESIRQPQFVETLRQVRADGLNRRIEIPVGETVYLCSFAPLPIQKAVAVLWFDVTELKRLETIKKDLVVNISHEFKTPLTTIRGFAEALEEDPAHQREFLEIIKRNAERLTAITNDLLLLARLEYKEKPLNFEPVDLAALARESAAGFAAAVRGKGLELAVAAEENLPPVNGDRFMLEQVFTNLLENSVRYSEAGRIDVRLRREGSAVVTEVADTGIGIPAEHLPRIFERFYVVDKSRSRRQGGTGLGLSIVRNIVRQHGGEISARSTPGQGTTFTVTLPAS